ERGPAWLQDTTDKNSNRNDHGAPMIADYFQTLMNYNRWANGLVLQKAGEASRDDYHAEVPGLSFGSLHGTLVHAFIAELVWVSRWMGSMPPDHLKDARTSNLIAAEHIP